jgi:hypothetical protein
LAKLPQKNEFLPCTLLPFHHLNFVVNVTYDLHFNLIRKAYAKVFTSAVAKFIN